MTDRYNRILCSFIAVLYGVALICYCITLPYNSVTWYDNVVINEMARGGVARKALDWSVVATGSVALDSQSWANYYLGGLLTEISFRCLGWIGPRIFLLFVYLVVSGLVFAYARMKGGTFLFAGLLSFFFFVFPRLSYGVKGCRVDIVSLGFMFAALTILAWLRRTRYHCPSLFVAGALGACSFFSWFTAVIAFPALAWEVDDSVRDSFSSWRQRICGYCLASLGFILISLVLAMPFLLDFNTTVAGIKANLAYNLQESARNQGSQLASYLKSLFALPCFYILGAFAVFSRKRFWILMSGFVGFSLVTIVTKAGNARMLYFIPSMLVAISVMYSELRSTGRKMLVCVVIGVAVLSFGRTVILRTAEEIKYKDRRDVAAVQTELESVIGRNAVVYTDSFQLYYIGRNLGWKMYRVGSSAGIDPLPYLKKCDWYLFGWCELDGVSETVLKQAGFIFDREVCRRDPAERPSALYYGPYHLYRRVKN